ncbi:MFS transporter [Kineococcus aurantiacus]|uniref:Putative MFS family arabinose efflux permease n=1 Tax=Kineococcus aurantiacus TaxID=37633 RepID=A0A7Y9DMF3_9ACTN|nr:putative MFS family arabinose efflux permease [Kineococcus aurantiacus]
MVAGAGLIAVTYGVARFGFGLQLTQLAAEFSLTPGTSGLIASGSFAAYCVTALLARRVIERRGGRRALWLAAALAAAGAVVVSLAWTAPVLALGILVAGSAAGAASPALVAAVSTTTPRELVARRQAVVNAGTGIGVAAAGVVALFGPQTWRPVWIAAAVAALLTAAVVDRRTTWPPRPGDDHDPGQDPAAAPAGAATGEDGTRRPLLRPVLAAALAGLGSAAVWTFGRDLLTTVGQLPGRTTATLWVLLGATAVLGALSGDAVRVLGMRWAWWLTVALSAISTGVLALAAGDVVAAGIAVVVFGGSYTALSGVLITWAGALRPHSAGAATATLFIALTAGQAAGSLLTGGLGAVLGPRAAFLVCSAVLVSAAVVPPHRPRAGRR